MFYHDTHNYFLMLYNFEKKRPTKNFTSGIPFFWLVTSDINNIHIHIYLEFFNSSRPFFYHVKRMKNEKVIINCVIA